MSSRKEGSFSLEFAKQEIKSRAFCEALQFRLLLARRPRTALASEGVFSLGIAKEQSRKTRFSISPAAMIVQGRNVRKLASSGRRGGSFLRVLNDVNKHKPAAGAAAMPFACFFNRNSHKQLEATARRAIRKQSLKKKLRLRERRRPR